jgi:hypothetical protein
LQIDSGTQYLDLAENWTESLVKRICFESGQYQHSSAYLPEFFSCFAKVNMAEDWVMHNTYVYEGRKIILVTIHQITIHIEQGSRSKNSVAHKGG